MFKPHAVELTPLKERSVCSVFRTQDGRAITLRPLRRGDLNALVPFANSFARERKRNKELGITSMERRVTRAEEKEFLDKALREMAKRRRVCIAAFDGHRLVGHCDIAGRTARDERHTGVLGIVVVEGYRGVGLGQEMIRTALRQVVKLGIWAIELEVFATNEPAKHIYEKLGFKMVGIIPKKVLRDGEFTDMVRMYIHLSLLSCIILGFRAYHPSCLCPFPSPCQRCHEPVVNRRLQQHLPGHVTEPSG